MKVSELDRANFFSQAINSARSFRLESSGDLQLFLEREARIFAVARGHDPSDIAEIVRNIPASWLDRPHDIRDRFRSAALDALAEHFGYTSPKRFKELVKAVSRGVSSALDESGWIKTDGMGQGLLELCYSSSDFDLQQHLKLGLGTVGETVVPSAEAIAARIRAEEGLSIAVEGGGDRALVVHLPDRGADLRRSAMMKPGEPDKVTLWYGIGNPFVQRSHSADYVKNGERWISTSEAHGPVEPGTFEHRVFEALASSARSG